MTSAALREQEPSISVIVTAHNHATLLPRCLGSLSRQTRPPDQIIIVDDGSSDATPAVLRDWSQPNSQIITQPNLGVSMARNNGLMAATGMYVLFLDDDDSLPDKALELLTDAYTRDRPADLIHGDWTFVSDRSGRFHRQSAFLGEHPLETLLCRNPMAVHSVMVRRDAVVALGGFRDRQGALEDWELWLRLALGETRVSHVPEVVAYYHWRTGSGSSHIDRMHAVRRTVLTEQRPYLLNRVVDEAWIAAEVGLWLDHAANHLRGGDVPSAAGAMWEAARHRQKILTDVSTFYQMWRADYLEALGDISPEEILERWKCRRQRMKTLVSILTESRRLASDIEAACDLAYVQALRDEGQSQSALVAAVDAVRRRPMWLRNPQLLRLAGRSMVDSLRSLRHCA